MLFVLICVEDSFRGCVFCKNRVAVPCWQILTYEIAASTSLLRSRSNVVVKLKIFRTFWPAKSSTWVAKRELFRNLFKVQVYIYGKQWFGYTCVCTLSKNTGKWLYKTKSAHSTSGESHPEFKDKEWFCVFVNSRPNNHTKLPIVKYSEGLQWVA